MSRASEIIARVTRLKWGTYERERIAWFKSERLRLAVEKKRRAA